MEDVISGASLRSQLDNPQVVIVDCRFLLSDPAFGQQQYQVSHIPGAHYLHLDRDLSGTDGGGRHPLPDPEVLGAKLAALGITWGETLVVPYDDSKMAFAARLWWLLRYYGHDRVAILDGGWSGWLGSGYPVTDALPTPQPGQFRAQVQGDWVVSLETVKIRKDSPNVVLIDSREGDRFRGEREPIDPVAGNIPGAVNFPWLEALTPEGYWRPIVEHQQRWANLNDDQELIVYCGSGVTACVNLLSLKQAGLTRAKLYPGGWSQWCTQTP